MGEVRLTSVSGVQYYMEVNLDDCIGAILLKDFIEVSPDDFYDTTVRLATEQIETVEIL